MTMATSQGSVFSAGPRRGSEHASGSKAPMSCFLKRKEQENAEPSEKAKAVRESDREAGKRQQGSDRKLQDLVAVLPGASWPACSASLQWLAKGFFPRLCWAALHARLDPEGSGWVCSPNPNSFQAGRTLPPFPSAGSTAAGKPWVWEQAPSLWAGETPPGSPAAWIPGSALVPPGLTVGFEKL